MSGRDERILLAHGGGGELMQRLIKERVLPRLANELLDPLADSAILPATAGKLCFTTDSFVVQPLEFPGGDIGRLAVCGTVNDLAVMGATPLALSLGLIVEEGLDLTLLERMLDSLAAAAKEAKVPVATGDTKVIEQRGSGGILINTAGIGAVRDDVALDTARIAAGDLLLINGDIAEHGLAVMSVREHLAFDTDIRSDAAPLNGLIAALIDSGADVKFMRDPTRGGLAGVLADLVEASGLSIEVDESEIPLSPQARSTADMLGLDPLTVANEGKVVAVLPAADAERALAVLRQHPLGARSARIGRFVDAAPPLVELITRGGGRRLVSRPYGEELPRIC